MEIKPVYLFLSAFIVIIFGLVVIQEASSNIESIDLVNFNSTQNFTIANGSSETLDNVAISSEPKVFNRTFVEKEASFTINLGARGFMTSNNVSYSGWHNVTSSISNENLIDITAGFEVFLYNNTLLGCEVESATEGIFTINSTHGQLNDGQWHQIGCTYRDNGNLTLYYDGEITATETRLMTDSGSVSITSYLGSYGQADELRYYGNNALTSLQMQEIYNSGRISNTSLVSTGLDQWFSLNENSGLTIHDAAGGSTKSLTTTLGAPTWENDGVNITLVEDTDYTLSGNTFRLINSQWAWSFIDIDYVYQNRVNTRNVSVARLINVFVALAILSFLLLIVNYYRKEFQ